MIRESKSKAFLRNQENRAFQVLYGYYLYPKALILGEVAGYIIPIHDMKDNPVALPVDQQGVIFRAQPLVITFQYTKNQFITGKHSDSKSLIKYNQGSNPKPIKIFSSVLTAIKIRTHDITDPFLSIFAHCDLHEFSPVGL